MGSILGITHGAYLNYENGKAEPKQEMLVKIAKFFGVTPNYLLGFEDYP